MYPKVLSLHFEYKVREVLGENVTTDWLRAVVLEFYFWLLFVVITQLKKEPGALEPGLYLTWPLCFSPKWNPIIWFWNY